MSIDRPLIATTTVSTRQQADALAEGLIADRVAACVQIDGPITSHYVWQDQVESATEWRLTIKSRQSVAATLWQKVLDRHPYDVPEWLVTAVDEVSPAYWDWICQIVPAGTPS